MSKPTIVLVGRLGKDPKDIADGKGVAFSVAVNVGKDATDWYDVAAWKNLDFIKKYVKKGSAVVVSGLVTFFDGEKGRRVNVEATSVQFAGVGGGGQKKSEDGTPRQENERAVPTEDDIPF